MKFLLNFNFYLFHQYSITTPCHLTDLTLVYSGMNNILNILTNQYIEHLDQSVCKQSRCQLLHSVQDATLLDMSQAPCPFNNL